MKKLLKNALPLAMLAAMAALPLSACGADVEAAFTLDNSVVVSTVSPAFGDIVVMGEYIGIMEPNQMVAVIPRVPGDVLSVNFNVGDVVSVGDILFTIDPTDIITNIAALEAQLEVQNATVMAARTGVSLVDGSAMQSQLLSADGGVIQAEAGIAQAEAGIAQAEAAVIQAEVGISQAEAGIAQAQQNVYQARVGVEQAQMGYNMAYQGLNDSATLLEAGIISRIAFEQAEAGHLNAQAALERAESGYEMAIIGLSQAELGRTQASQGLVQAQQALATAQRGHAQAVEGHAQAIEGQRILSEVAPAENRQRAQDGLAQAEAARNTVLVNLEAARERLDDAIVTSPISGVVMARNVDEFSFASPQAAAFIISDVDSMTAAFRVPRLSADNLEIGGVVTLNDGNAVIQGTITEIASAVDMGGLLTIRAHIPNPPDSLIDGMSVRIFAVSQNATNALTLPLSAIHHDRGEAHVFIAENGIARRMPVQLGVFDDSYAEILYGIDPSHQIINTWSARLADGAEIEISTGSGV